MHGPAVDSWPVRWRVSVRQERAGAPLIRGRYVPCATAGGGWHAERWAMVVVGPVEGKAEEGWHVLVGTASSNATQRNATQRSAAGRQNDKTGGGAAKSSGEIAWRITRRPCW